MSDVAAFRVDSEQHGCVARELPILTALRLAAWLSDEGPVMVIETKRDRHAAAAVFIRGKLQDWWTD